MKNITSLAKQAINAAREQDWNQAIEINEKILDERPNDVGALNRLALARMQLGHVRIAEEILEKVLKIDKHNKIAKKNLEKAQNKERGQTVKLGRNNSYIEEPGKAKVVPLTRVTEQENLQEMSVGQACSLDANKKYVSVNVSDSDQYLGALTLDISQRLIKLINNGNKYSCQIHSIKNGDCKVHIKEQYISKKNQGITSFPVSKENGSNANNLAEEHRVQEDIPLDIVHTDTDEELSERNLKSIPKN